MSTQTLSESRPSPFQYTLPVLFGYIPLGMAFGILFQKLGFAWYYATFAGVFIYAGSAQLIAVGMLAAQATLVDIFLTVFFLNMRHICYGFSLISDYGQVPWRKRFYMIFGLTDETYSLLTAHDSPNEKAEESFALHVTLYNHLYWIAGCTLGAIAGSSFEINTQGFEFVLTALFTVLLIEQALKVRRPFPFLIAALSATVALIYFREKFIVVSLLISSLVFLALSYRKERRDG